MSVHHAAARLTAVVAPLLLISATASFGQSSGGPQPEHPPFIVNVRDGAEMIFVAPGQFLMGDDDQIDNPRHTVTLSGYYIYRDLVTVRQFKDFCHATGRRMPNAPGFDPEWKLDGHPIINVTWQDALDYAKWAGGTLPTEAQWERSARGTDGRRYLWGDHFELSRLWAVNERRGDLVATYPDGSFDPSPCGCRDMAGNVWQWCLDWYDANYWRSPAAAAPDPENGTADDHQEHVLRGGAWYGEFPLSFRSSFPHRYSPSDKRGYDGFRCVHAEVAP